VVVTGAGRGIGRSIAQTMARAGATVAALSRTGGEVTAVVEEIVAAGGAGRAFTADVTVGEEVASAFAAIEAELGPVGVVVNNAGTNLALGLPWEVDPDEWWCDVETTLRGTFHWTQVAGRAMVERGSGRIINISSGAASEPRPYSAGYAAVKTAAQRYSESVAPVFQEHGVHVFSLNPGPVRTTLNDRGKNSESGRRYATDVPADQYLAAERVAGHALFLAEGRGDVLAGRYLTAFEDIEQVVADERLADPEFLTLRIKGWEWPR